MSKLTQRRKSAIGSLKQDRFKPWFFVYLKKVSLHKCVPKKRTSSFKQKRIENKGTLRNWLRTVANKKTRIFDPRRGYKINVQGESSAWLDKTANRSRHDTEQLGNARVKATKHKANPATYDVRVENRNHGRVKLIQKLSDYQGRN